MEAKKSVVGRLNITIILGGIFALAFFVRSYFVYDLALKDFLVSGGSDAYYYRWTIEHIVTTGRHLLHDGMLNYPLGMNNPRPPIYGWSVSLVGIVLGNLQGSLELGIWQSFLFSTAFWGALTIFPTYFLGRDVFGHRAGLVAAFFLALLPAHIQRSPLSNGDHDALVLFFVVTAFYFFLKALSELKEERWVSNWASPAAIRRGIRKLVLGSKRTILLSIMSGAAVATVALTWQGWAYVPVVILAYFIVQLLVHQVRNQDPLGVLLVFTVTLGTALLLAAPYYMATGFVRTWFDVPLILFAASVGLGILFTVFHRLPWVLVIPPVALGFAGGLAVASLYSPTVAQALTSGFGYFAPNKVFETIAEAQPPALSQAILSFGAVTYYLSLFGIVWMAIQFVRKPRPGYLFALAWSAAAIFMAMSAVRFIFNAAPAFAITSGWVTVLIVERLGFEQVRKAVAATGGSRWTAFRKGIKARHIAGALFVAFLLILPNTWYAVDAAVPFEKKQELDREVYNAIPEPLRPSGYQEGSLFYFGAFGYSLPLKNTYFPRAWEWLRQQDVEVLPFTHRPAFLSWWDYGFESIQEGRHPTVADNFQNGLEFAGHFLLAQSENEGIAVLNIRLLQGDLNRRGGEFSNGVVQALEKAGLDPEPIKDALAQPAAYVPLIRLDPDRFGRWDLRLSPGNARIVYLKTVLTEELDLDAQAELYRDIRLATGNSVAYFAVDSRLIPFSGTNTGIFYAPAKLTDHRVAELPDLRSIPFDFYRLVAETDRGEYDLDKVPPAARVTNIRIEYQEMFYNSMLYKIFFGIKGSDVGGQDVGLPGFSGQLTGETPMQGWMLEHFRLVYRTAYYNPFPPEDVANHTEEWTAANVFDALDLQDRIDRGEAQGTVDLRAASSLAQGIVILKYYDGAIMRGRVLTDTGEPLEGVRITVLDEIDIPHATTLTDSQGLYQISPPFGRLRVVASIGDLDPRTQTGSVTLGEKVIEIREDQAARLPLDSDGDGRPDYIVQEDFVVEGSKVMGIAFLDVNGNSLKDAGERALEGLDVQILDVRGRVYGEGKTGPGGAYEIGGLLPGNYGAVLIRDGVTLQGADVSLEIGQTVTKNIGVPTGRLVGRVANEFGEPAVGVTIQLLEEATGLRTEIIPDEAGNYTADGLVEGNYTVEASTGDRGSLAERVRIVRNSNTTRDLVVGRMGEVNGRTLLSFRPLPFATVTLWARADRSSFSLKADSSGRFSATLPEGIYDAYALHFEGGQPYSFLGTLDLAPAPQVWEVHLEPAVKIDGLVTGLDGDGTGTSVTFQFRGAFHTVTSNQDNLFSLYLPSGSYGVWALQEDGQYVASLTFLKSTFLNISLSPGERIEGRTFRDLNGNGTWEPGEGLDGIRMDFLDSSGNAFSISTQDDGAYGVPLLENIDYTLSIQEEGFHPFLLGPLPPSGFVERAFIELEAKDVKIDGKLVSAEGLNLEGTPVSFLALGEGAGFASVEASEDGSFSASLLPGLYSVEVNASLDSTDDVKIQNLREETLRVRIAKGADFLTLEVVKRVKVGGTLELEGSPFGGSLFFSGTEERSVEVTGDFSLYVRPGNYTLFASSPSESGGYIFLNFTSIASPLNFTSSLTKAAILSGSVKVAGKPAARALLLEFLRQDGARVVVETTATGGYSAALATGTYDISLDWRGVDHVDGPPRFVRYTLSQVVGVEAGGSAELDLDVSRSLDNSTLTGRVLLSGQLTPASLSFAGTNETALSTALEVPGAFTVPLAPGVYNVYAYRETGKSVSLSRFEVLPYVENTIEIQLEPGYRVAGVVSLEDGSKVRADLQFAAEASVSITTDDTGIFSTYLPAGQYNVGAEAKRRERGVLVDYTSSESLDLRESKTLDLRLSRIDVPGVDLEWDASQRTTVAAGGLVEYTLSVRNTGNLKDTFTLKADVEGWTFNFKPRTVTLPFGIDNAATVTVKIASPEDAKVEHEPLLIEVSSTSDTGARDGIVVDVDILQRRGILLRISDQPPALSPEALEYQLEVLNRGNGPDSYTLILMNPQTLATQGWQASLVHQERIDPRQVGNIQIPVGDSANVTLRLEPVGAVSVTQAVLLAFSEVDRTVEDILEVRLAFPSLSIPAEDVDVQGRNVRVGAEEFPVLLYGTMAVAAAIVAFLLIRSRRRGRRR